MALFELKAEIPLDAVSEVEELIAAMEEGRLLVLEDKPSARAWLTGYFADEAEARDAWRRMSGALSEDAPLGRPEVREMPDQDWRDSYKAHFRAWHFGPLHWVPVWERETYTLPPGDAVVWLDPGLAFGTGNHETTRLCCERLAEFSAARKAQAGARFSERRPERVLDAGCGSGILALSAARLGFSWVEGFDNDPEAVRVSLENAALNGLDGRVPFFTADLAEGLAGRHVDFLMANIQSDVLLRAARDLCGAVSPGGVLAMSGILATELDIVHRAFASVAPGWSLDSRTLGAWSDLCLSRPAGSIEATLR